MAPRPIRFIFLALCGTGMLWVTFSRARDLLQLDVSIGLGICSIVLGLGLIFFSFAVRRTLAISSTSDER